MCAEGALDPHWEAQHHSDHSLSFPFCRAGHAAQIHGRAVGESQPCWQPKSEPQRLGMTGISHVGQIRAHQIALQQGTALMKEVVIEQ